MKTFHKSICFVLFQQSPVLKTTATVVVSVIKTKDTHLGAAVSVNDELPWSQVLTAGEGVRGWASIALMFTFVGVLLSQSMQAAWDYCFIVGYTFILANSTSL